MIIFLKQALTLELLPVYAGRQQRTAYQTS
ncbi:hypothetical protein VPAL9027_00561 [Vibrio palustris]|uniref:Uncharacterized protein n=1 Tax=Vibrio palustris TaxID=1918946 RepID=A0A1R4B149_9VIBR|nr:hypothetical protein VPAL9027_00561 [Vibrio palustris]